MSWDNTKFKKYDTSEGYGNRREWKRAFKERLMSDEEAAEILEDQEETPYSLLGIKPAATQAEVKRAFRIKINEWHPDRNQHREKEATEMSKKIIAAYTILSSKRN